MVLFPLMVEDITIFCSSHDCAPTWCFIIKELSRSRNDHKAYYVHRPEQDLHQVQKLSALITDLHPADRKKCRCADQNGCDIGVFIVSGTNWLEQMVREMETKDAKYTEEEMKDRISALKKLQMFPHIEFGDPGVLENPVLGMKMVAVFSGFSLREAEFSRIAKKTSFQPTKEKFKENHGKFRDILFSEGKSLLEL
ncbi:hypothetical protein ASZ78_017121 [Callipepla squamata]|uniref:Sulfotransferase n=1 Tax=Callipepla squamata TaxID=9009 RepID=A0A226NCW1_CALSU|nr:hypothetical protein ASZ78_017121 [Callipepla squamata]